MSHELKGDVPDTPGVTRDITVVCPEHGKMTLVVDDSVEDGEELLCPHCGKVVDVTDDGPDDGCPNDPDLPDSEGGEPD